MSAIEISSLGVILGILAFAQRLGGWEHKRIGAMLGYVAAIGGVFWAFSFRSKPLAWLITAAIVAFVIWVKKTSLLPLSLALSIFKNRGKQTGPVLQFHGSRNWGNRLVIPPAPVQSLWCIWVKNSQTKKQTVAHNVKSQIEYRDHDGADSQTVRDVLWIEDRFLNGKPQGSFESHSVDLSMDEDCCFIFALEGPDHPIPFGALSERPNGTRVATGLGLGSWKARILVTADNCKPLKGEIDFDILPPEPGDTRYRFANIIMQLPVLNARW
jgi:hypothetical protein